MNGTAGNGVARSAWYRQSRVETNTAARPHPVEAGAAPENTRPSTRAGGGRGAMSRPLPSKRRPADQLQGASVGSQYQVLTSGM